MKILSLLFVCLILSACACGASAQVVSVNKDNFEKTIKQSELTLVKFFAPWCGHCQKLAPEYEKAAESLAGKATLAEMDCTVETNREVCSQHSVTGYPTLIFFRNGVEHSKYTGPRSAQGFINFIESQVGPAIQLVTSATELSTLINGGKPVALLVSESDSSTSAAQFKELADQHRLYFSFALATDKSVADVPQDVITVMRTGEKETYSGDGSVESIQKFLKLARLPFIGEISPDTVSLYAEFFNDGADAFPSGWLLLDKLDADLLTSIGGVAGVRRDRIVLLWADTNKYSGVATHIGLPPNATFPAFAIQMKGHHYVFPVDVPLTAEALATFIDQTLEGKVEATIRSEPLPEPETEKGLTTLVAESFPNYLHKADLLVLFYAPWCGHCKNFKPVFASFAEEMEASPLVVAQMDATKNDYDRELFPLTGFPAVYFVPASGSPVEYTGDRTIESLRSFISENGMGKQVKDPEDKTDL